MIPASLREQILKRRDSLEEHKRAEMSLRAAERLSTLPAMRRADLPLFFISFRSEVDTHDIIKRRLAQGLPVLVPRSLIKERRLEVYRIYDWERDLRTGAYGILEPVPGVAEELRNPALIDFVLVPGSVFDRKCGRYGYGAGFYDRFLSSHAVNALRVGFGFSFQVMDEIPLFPHDERLDIIVTDEEVISCKDAEV